MHGRFEDTIPLCRTVRAHDSTRTIFNAVVTFLASVTYPVSRMLWKDSVGG